MLADLIKQRADSVIIVAAGTSVPDWVQGELQYEVLLPYEAKGLEFQTVVVLDPGKVISQAHTQGDSDKLREAELRTTIDLLKVAMSRATESLVFMDVAASPMVEQASRDLLGQTSSLDCETAFQSILEGPEENEDLEGRVQRLVDQSRTLRDDRPDSAWRRAYHAMELLGDPSRPQGVKSCDVRAAVYREVCDSAIRFLARGEAAHAVLAAAVKAADGLGIELSKTEEVSEPLKSLFASLQRLSMQSTYNDMLLLASVARLGPELRWVETALTAISERLRLVIEEAAADPDCAKRFASGDPVDWLRITGFIDDPTEKLRSLRRKALSTLIDARKVAEAQSVLNAHDLADSEDYELKGRLLELQGNYPEAANAYEKAGNAHAAVLALRHSAQWESAARLRDQIPETEAAQLSWLLDASRLAERRPEGLWESLSSAERERLHQHAPPMARR